MSEIKFACPHCAQHIACESDYADMCIVCPGCGKPMLVPILSAVDAAHPDLCLVAAIPAPRQKFRSHLPMLDPWTEEEWEQNVRSKAHEPSGQTPFWIVSALVTIVLAAALRAGGTGWGAIVVTLVVGSLLSGYLLRRAGAGSWEGASIGDAVGRGVTAVFVVMLAIPLVALGVLFIGCGVCG
jgi:hypothetical protein